jgi:hypothetical protein
MNRASSALSTISGWMTTAANAGGPVDAEQVRTWCRALAIIHTAMVKDELAIATAVDGMATLPTDRINAVEAEMAHDAICQLVKYLANLAADAATLKELPKIDEAASAVIDLSEKLTLGVARPVPTQKTGG